MVLVDGHQISLPLRVSSSNPISVNNVTWLCVVSTGPNKGKQNKGVCSTKGRGTEQRTGTNNSNLLNTTLLKIPTIKKICTISLARISNVSTSSQLLV